MAFPPEVRRVIYTANSIEALNRQLGRTPRFVGAVLVYCRSCSVGFASAKLPPS